MKKIVSLLLLLIFFFSFIDVFTQNVAGKPEVKHPVYFDVSPPLRDMAKILPKADNSLKVIKNYFNARKTRNKETFSSDWADPLVQKHQKHNMTTSDSTIQNFLGGTNNQGYDPPDTYGVVGLNDYFQVVNCHFSIYSKTGTLLLGPTSNMTIWNGMPNNMDGGDGVVMYDKQADRWIMTQLSYPGSLDFEMIAVSQTSDPTGSWYRWEYEFNCLPDYPKFGVWPDGYYMSVNCFGSVSGNYQGTGQAVFDRAAMLVGDTGARMVYLTLPATNNAYSFLPSDCDGDFPPLGTPNYYVYMMDSPDYLGVYQFHVDWTNTSNSTFDQFLELPVSTFNDNLSGIPQKGTTRKADALSDRLMYRLQFRKFTDHWSLVCNHSVNIGSGVSGIRWYELRKTTGDWSVYQQSTYSIDGNSRWMASVAMDTAGNIGMGYSISSGNMYPAIKFTGRLKNDPLNVMDIPEKGIFYGTGSNTANDGGGVCRWGDYSSMTMDPTDGMTFWYTQEYMTSMSSNWQTRIASFNFIGIITINLTASPDTICLGDSTQLNALVNGGSGTYTYSWTSIPAGFISTLRNPKVAPAIPTSYILTVNDGTTTQTDTILVNVNGTIIADAGPNASYPNTTLTFNVLGSALNYSSTKWLTAGDGQFIIDTILNTTYTTGPNDRQNGGVLLTLEAYPLYPCSDTATDTVFIALTFPVGLVSNAKTDFSANIIPNPNKGIFNLVIKDARNQGLTITITDLEGKTIFLDQDKPQSQEYSKTIDLTSFPKGTYMVRIKTDLQVITKKLVIQ
jgi:hypothetical protein